MGVKSTPLRWVGRRGAVLILFGLAFVAYGTRVVTEPVDTDTSRALLHLMTPRGVRAAVWIVVGACATFTPLATRWTPLRDTTGFVLAYLPPMLTALSFLLGWLVYLLPLPIPGDPGGFGAAAIWTAFAGVLVICSGWPEHPDLPSTGKHQ